MFYKLLITLFLFAAEAYPMDNKAFNDKINGSYDFNHYMLGFMQNEIEGPIDSLYLIVYLTSKEATEVTIEDMYSGE